MNPLKLRRRSAKITMEEFGKRVGVSKQMICQIEKGIAHCPLKIKIEYLKLNPDENDKIIIEYLEKELENERNNIFKKEVR